MLQHTSSLSISLHLHWVHVESFLNFVWLVLSAVLIAAVCLAAKRAHRKMGWQSVIALSLLLLLLFPVISITDDLVAFAAPTEVEHALRLTEGPLLHFVATCLPSAAALFALALFSFLATGIVLPKTASPLYTRKARAGFLRALGVRPPPTLAS